MSKFFEEFDEKQWQLLQARARRVEQSAQENERRNLFDVLTVQVGDETYAISVSAIRAVYEDITVTELPGVPEHIAGIANIRGQLVTIMSLGKILDIAQGKTTRENNAVITLAFEDMQAGLLVDEVSEVSSISLDDLSTLPVAATHNTTYMKGSLSDGTILLDLTAMLHDKALTVDQGE